MTELGPRKFLSWKKSTASADTACVEVANAVEGGTLVRDSKNLSGPVLSFSKAEWEKFLLDARIGRFDN